MPEIEHHHYSCEKEGSGACKNLNYKSSRQHFKGFEKSIHFAVWQRLIDCQLLCNSLLLTVCRCQTTLVLQQSRASLKLGNAHIICYLTWYYNKNLSARQPPRTCQIIQRGGFLNSLLRALKSLQLYKNFPLRKEWWGASCRTHFGSWWSEMRSLDKNMIIITLFWC